MTLFIEFAKTCENLSKTRKRKEKEKILGEFFKKLSREEISIATNFLIGKPFPQKSEKTLDISWRTLKKVGKQQLLYKKPLEIKDVYKYFEKIAEACGESSRKKKEMLFESLINQADALEKEYIFKIVFGEMQHGVGEGVVISAISEITGISVDVVRKAYMLSDLGKVAELALTQGKKALIQIDVEFFTPIQPMLAEMAYDFETIFSHHKKSAFEYKFDGARIQIHKMKKKVRIFSRRLSDVTDSLPEVEEIAREFEDGIYEGEVVACKQGKPLPFQDLMRRFRRVHDIETVRREIPLKLYLFDVLYHKNSLFDAKYVERRKILKDLCGDYVAEQIVTDEKKKAEEFLEKALKLGHEGLMAKALDSKYQPGSRGKLWFKIKPTETLDCIIIAADWGYGRRSSWLSNYHLALRDEDSGELMMVGKTFKGLTDEEFKEMTKRLLELKKGETRNTVFVKPEVVVEVAFNEIQKSPHYKSGFALRFARITRIRWDKRECDSFKKLKWLYEEQFRFKGKL